MSIFDNDPFGIGGPEIYASQHQSWEKITTPDGQTYYKVPGNTGYVYDPVLSRARGRAVFRANPQEQIDQVNAQKEAQKQEAFNRSPLGQLTPVAGTIGGTGAAIFAADAIRDRGTEAVANAISPGAGSVPQALPVTNIPVSNGAAAAQGAQALPVSSLQTSGGEAVAIGTAENGGTLMSDGSIVGGPSGWTTAPANGSIGQIAAAAAALKGGYDTFQGFQRGGEGIRSGTTQMGAGIGGMVGGPLGAGVGALAGNSIGYGLQGSGFKNDLALAPLTFGMSLIPGVGDGIRGLIHKTTKQVQQENTAKLLDQNKDDKVYQDYITTNRGAWHASEPDKDMPFGDSKGNKFATFDEFKKAGLDPAILSNAAVGNMKTFGSAWAGLSEPQRIAVTKGIIDADLYKSEKGEVEISDAAKAKEIYDNVLKGFSVGAATNAQAAAQGAIATPMTGNPNVNTTGLQLKRSNTRSPGFDMNGRRIQY